MRKFNLTIIINSSLDKAGIDKVLGKIKKIIDTASGKIGNTDEWGKKTFSYPIKKQKEGYFVNFDLELEAKEVKGLDTKIRNEENLLRHLLVRVEK
jgi:small subunit ribosomal protein S6